MIVKGYDLEKLRFVGFWDDCIFEHPDFECGYLYEDADGKKIKISYGDIKQAKKKLEKEKEKCVTK